MKKTRKTIARIVATAAGASALLIAGTSQAALQDRDLDGDSVVDAFYDTDLDITWLRDANINGWMGGGMGGGQPAAIAWAEALTFAGYDDWRLLLSTYDSCDGNWHCVASEMGHLWYVDLGNVAGGPMANTGGFQNLEVGLYLAGNGVYGGDYYFPFFFDTETGYQSAIPVSGYAFAVRDGDIPAVPEPGTYALMLAGLTALALARRRWPR